MIAPLLFSLMISSSLATGFQASVTELSEYLEYRTWQGQHWRLKANEPAKLLIQHMPDEKKISEEKTVDSIQYKTGGGAKYTALIEERTEKGIKSFIIRHISENGKDNHLDTHISYMGWDNVSHVATVVSKDGQIRWVISEDAKKAAIAVPATTSGSSEKKSTAVRTTSEKKTKTGG